MGIQAASKRRRACSREVQGFLSCLNGPLSYHAVHRRLAGLLHDGIVERVSDATAYLPSSRRYNLTAKGVGEAAGTLGFDTATDFVRDYPVYREWLTLLTITPK